jgi:hypothetical protein
LLTNEKVTEIVVNEQFTEALRQTALVNSIEFSGFGRFVLLPVKARKQMEKYMRVKEFLENELASLDKQEDIDRMLFKLQGLNKNIEHLKPKLR